MARGLSRDPRLLAYRVGVGILLLLLGWVTVMTTIAGITRRQRPEVALQFRAHDAFALAQVAAREQLDTPRRPDAERLRALAEEALTRDPTAAPAFRVLGILESMQGRIEPALRLMRYSHELTRRDLGTQLWLIEYNVQRNDIPATLRHFDAATSSSSGATTLLFPVLVNALNERHLIEPMAAMLRRDPWWRASLLSAMAQETRSTENVAALFDLLARQGKTPRADIIATLVRRLDQEGKSAQAARMRRLMQEAPPPQPADELSAAQ